jgi:membrane dipeptidase
VPKTSGALKALVFASFAWPALSQAAPAAPAVTPAVRAIHERLLTIDTHLDTPANFAKPGWDIMQRHDVATDGSQVDYPRMVEGGLDGGLFAVYTAQNARTPEGRAEARDAALKRAVEIHEMVAAHPAQFALVTTPDEARKVAASGKRFVFISMENGVPFGQDLTLMQTFYDLGVRVMSPVHFLNNDLGDSSTDPKGPEWHGLSPIGKDFVVRANRMGILIDQSHASDEVLDQLLALSKAPIILTHSGCKAIYNHPRNIDDAHLKALAAKGGVIQINAYNAYMIDIPKNPERDAALAALQAKYGPGGRRAEGEAEAEYKAILAKYPTPHATFDDFLKHLFHAIDVAGIDHVGIGPDMDGGGGLVGFEDIVSYPKVTAALLAKGYSEADVQKVWSGNALRVMAQAQALRQPTP